MELQVSEIQIPEKISFNYDELKNELAEVLKRYENVVYTADQMKLAKGDKATLNKLKKALNDERIRREREYMSPFAEFKAQIDDLIKAIDKPVALIDRQVKEYEEQKKCEKRQAIEEYFDSQCDFPEWLKFDRIFVPSWLNATCSMKTVEGDLKAMQETICRDLAVLSEMPAFGFEATEVYKQTLNLQTAVNEGKRLADIQKRKEEAERLKAEREAAMKAKAEESALFELEQEATVEKVSAVGESVSVGETVGESVGQWIAFKAFLTVAQAVELKKFFNRNGIDFKPI